MNTKTINRSLTGAVPQIYYPQKHRQCQELSVSVTTRLLICCNGVAISMRFVVLCRLAYNSPCLILFPFQCMVLKKFAVQCDIFSVVFIIPLTVQVND